MTERCADCGKTVVRRRKGVWGERLANNGLSFCCRTVVADGRLVSADYHYVEGETQRHFPTVLDTASSK